MEQVLKLANPGYVRTFQHLCGVTGRVGESVPDVRGGTVVSGRWVVSQGKTDSESENNNVIHRAAKTTGHDGEHPATGQPTLAEQKPYVIHYKSLYYLAIIGAFLGDELFYLTFFPFWFWNIDCVVGRQMGLLWCLVMYAGQATKDYLRWERPPYPPVFRLETAHLQEYAMPSTHAMAATVLPTVLIYLITERYEFSVLAAAAIVCVWSSVMCLSRLYLGVHTLLDVLCGCLYAAGIVALTFPYVKDLDYWMQTEPLAPVVLTVTGVAMCTVCYPSKVKNSAKGDAVQIIGITIGSAVGFWINYQLSLSSLPEVQPPYPITNPSMKWLGLSICRFASGCVVAAGARVAIKRASIIAFSFLFSLEKPDKNHPSVQTGYKFVTNFCTGICISFLIPAMHKLIGIHRPEFYFETL